jgi:uncharacterized membrane protein YfcA
LVWLLVGLISAAAAFLTLFSGFGLGTLLLPAFGWFFPASVAVAMTACVHFANNLAKLWMFAKHADKGVLLRFGIPAWMAAGVGAWLLGRLGRIPAVGTYTWMGKDFSITPLGLGLGGVMIIFALLEWSPSFGRARFSPQWQPLGGVLSGFFGGLSGHQGALRSAFLIKSGLDKKAFLGTGVVLACGVDAVRMVIYGLQVMGKGLELYHWALVAFAMGCAWMGVALGAKRFNKMTFPILQRELAVFLGAFGAAWMAGWL